MQKKRQHYIAQSYLKNFSSDRKYLYVFPFQKKKSFISDIKYLCKEDFFYGSDVIAQNFEDNLSIIENEHKKLIDKILDNYSLNCLNEDEYVGLLVLILFQASRTRSSKRRSRILAKIIEKKKKTLNITDSDVFQDFPRKIDPTEDFRLRQAFGVTMHAAINSVEAILDLTPALLINISDRNFICSDSPVVFYNDVQFDTDFKSDGLINPGLQIFYPISNEIVLLLFDHFAYKLDFDFDSICYLDKKNDIDAINKLQFINSLDFILFSEIKQNKNIEKIFQEVEKDIRKDVRRTFGSYFKGREFLEKIGMWHQFSLLSKYRTYKLRLSFMTLNTKYAKDQIDQYYEERKKDPNAIPTRNKSLANKAIDRLKKAHKKIEKIYKE